LRDFDKKFAQLGALRNQLYFQQLTGKILETKNLQDQAEGRTPSMALASGIARTGDRKH